MPNQKWIVSFVAMCQCATVVVRRRIYILMYCSCAACVRFAGLASQW